MSENGETKGPKMGSSAACFMATVPNPKIFDIKQAVLKELLDQIINRKCNGSSYDCRQMV